MDAEDLPRPKTKPGDPYFTVRCLICDGLIGLNDEVCRLDSVDGKIKWEIAHARCVEEAADGR